MEHIIEHGLGTLLSDTLKSELVDLYMCILDVIFGSAFDARSLVLQVP